MSESKLTLKSLFFDRATATDAPAVEAHDSMLSVQQDFAKKLPDLPWRTVAEELETKTDEILSLGIDEVLVGAWRTHKRFQTYRDPAKYPPTETILTSLAKHTVESTYDPAVKVLIADAEVASLDFQIQLALELEGIVLKIRAGRILEVHAGSYRVKGTLRCVVSTKFGSKVLFEKEDATAKHRFGRYCLGEGAEIAA